MQLTYLMDKTAKSEENFWDKVKKEDYCWEWTGCLSTRGYGRFGTSKNTFYAHRISYSWYVGELRREDVVMHKCDNPKCIRPSHLAKGTLKDNAADMVQKRRHIGTRTISESDVVSIRWRVFHGESRPKIAKEYNFSPQHFNAIISGKFWEKAGGPKTSRKGLYQSLIRRVLGGVTSGKTKREIASEENKSVAQIGKIIRDNA